MSVLIAFLSLAVEAKLGYPDRLFRWVGHPVTWIGRLISFIDRGLNRATASDRTRRLCGVLALVVIVAVPALIAYAVERVLLLHALGFFVVILLATTLLAQKSLADHVEAVARGLDRRIAGGSEGRLDDRRPRSRKTRPRRRGARGDREPGGEFFRRRRCARLLDGGRRAGRRRGLQGC